MGGKKDPSGREINIYSLNTNCCLEVNKTHNQRVSVAGRVLPGPQGLPAQGRGWWPPALGSSRSLQRWIIPRAPLPALRKAPPRASQMKKYCSQVRNARIVTNQIETLIFLLDLTGSAAFGGGFISAVNPRASSILFVPGNKSRLS